jgi:hypothetical protein
MKQNDSARAIAEGRRSEDRRIISANDGRSPHRGLSQMYRLKLLLTFAIFMCGGWRAHATVAAVAVQSPVLSSSAPTSVTTPIHFAATADSDLKVTGYGIYVDGNNVYRNSTPSLDTWVVLPPGGTHSVFITAWDDSGSHLSTATYLIDIMGVVPPTPPILASRMANIDKPESFSWTVDNGAGVGGQCNDGSIGTFDEGLDPNTANSPDFDGNGQHFVVKSRCTYDDSLFYWKNSQYPQFGHTNFLWDFWFYIPTTTQTSSVQALEFDFFQAVHLSDGVHEFMFGSQCNYATNQWQLWLPNKGRLAWMNAGISPCQFSAGTWHHAVYFLQRVTATGYQEIPLRFSTSTDTNNNLKFGTLSIDGVTKYLGQLSQSMIPTPAWSPVIGVQHQLDSAASGVTIEEYLDKESLTTW